ncbi:hypothetical protein KKH82_03030 [Patescibacteria group bacterium]|nr:hypothetical protein [Patescibacteria group bacterium]
MPDLCADRIDYSLRGALHYDRQTPAELMKFLDNLIAHDGKRVFKDYTWAKKYADLFFYVNDIYYSDLRTATMFQTSADYLKHAWEK